MSSSPVDMSRLPPLSSMEAFLEVARHGTVKAAAIELGLSMPALSRRIQTLEHAVGRPLFNRHHHGLSLTETGRALHAQLSPLLDELRTVIGQASRSEERRVGKECGSTCRSWGAPYNKK